MLVWPCFLFPTTVLEVLGFQNKASVHFFFIFIMERHQVAFKKYLPTLSAYSRQ
jgi:hypothetical protein